MVVSGDRDVYQLVGDGVRVMTTSRGVTDTKIYDRDGVIERYGVPPELVTDLIGLKGDTSDNIPGVPGIGDKTAAQLLQQFGVARGGARQRRRDLRREAQAEPDRARRRRPRLEAARDDARRRRRTELDARRGDGARRPTAARCATSAAEFELRAVIQRLEEEWDEDVPGRTVEETIEVEAQEGTPGRPRRRARSALAIARRPLGGQRRRADRRRRRRRPRRARRRARRPAARRPRRQVARRRRAHGLLAAAAPRGRRARPRPRHDGRRLPDRPRAAHLRARRARRRRGDLGRRRRAGAEDGPALARAEEGEAGRRPGRRRAARLASSPSASAPRLERARARARCCDEVEMPLIEVLAAMERDRAEARRRAARRDRRRHRRSRSTTLEAEIYELAGRRVHDRLAAAARPRSSSRSSG